MIGAASGGQIGDEPVDVVRTLAAVEAVPLEHEPLARHVFVHVVGRRRSGSGALAPSGSAGRFGGTAHSYATASRKSGIRLVSFSVSTLPFAPTPLGVFVFPANTSSPPTRSGEVRCRDALHRGVAYALDRVREGAGRHPEPSEKRASLRMVNVYVLPPS